MARAFSTSAPPYVPSMAPQGILGAGSVHVAGFWHRSWGAVAEGDVVFDSKGTVTNPPALLGRTKTFAETGTGSRHLASTRTCAEQPATAS